MWEVQFVQIKYEYNVKEGKGAARVDHDGIHFPKECKATFKVLCSDVCDSETVRVFYIVFPKFQMSPDFTWTVDTESAQGSRGCSTWRRPRSWA